MMFDRAKENAPIRSMLRLNSWTSTLSYEIINKPTIASKIHELSIFVNLSFRSTTPRITVKTVVYCMTNVAVVGPENRIP